MLTATAAAHAAQLAHAVDHAVDPHTLAAALCVVQPPHWAGLGWAGLGWRRRTPTPAPTAACAERPRVAGCKGVRVVAWCSPGCVCVCVRVCGGGWVQPNRHAHTVTATAPHTPHWSSAGVAGVPGGGQRCACCHTRAPTHVPPTHPHTHHTRTTHAPHTHTHTQLLKKLVVNRWGTIDRAICRCGSLLMRQYSAGRDQLRSGAPAAVYAVN